MTEKRIFVCKLLSLNMSDCSLLFMEKLQPPLKNVKPYQAQLFGKLTWSFRPSSYPSESAYNYINNNLEMQSKIIEMC